MAGAERAALAAERVVGALWRRLLATLRPGRSPAWHYHAALEVLRELPVALAGTLHVQLERLLHAGHAVEAEAVTQTLPAAAARRLIVRRLARPRPLREDETAGARTPGLLRLLVDPFGQFAADPAAELTGPDLHQVLKDLLFPPPPESWVKQVLAPLTRPADWAAIGTDADKRMPAELAHQLAADLSQGKSQRETAKGLLPYLDGQRYRARRAARTFGLHVAHQGQREADRGLGDLLKGQQTWAVVDEHTRFWHAARSGTVYYLDPGPGQKGPAQCPHPPLEAEDPAERPAGTPHIAWHCRCYLTPVLHDA